MGQITKIGIPFKDFKATDYPKGSVTQWFSENVELYKVIPGLTKGHNGIDMVAPWGTPLFAVEDGYVYDVNPDKGGYGMYVRLMCDRLGESREWTYGHLSEIKCKKGDIIKRGDCIGLMGNTGFVVSDSNGNGFWHFNPYAGTHLHLGLRKYKLVNALYQIQNYDNGWLGSIDYKDMLPEYTPPPIDWNEEGNWNLVLRFLNWWRLNK